MYSKKCRHCKKEFETALPHKAFCCDRCRLEAVSERRKLEHKKKKPEEKKPEKTQVKGYMTLEEVAKAARAEHLTYGQYVTKHGIQ